jgi:hypothetical protein
MRIDHRDGGSERGIGGIVVPTGGKEVSASPVGLGSA